MFLGSGMKWSSTRNKRHSITQILIISHANETNGNHLPACLLLEIHVGLLYLTDTITPQSYIKLWFVCRYNIIDSPLCTMKRHVSSASLGWDFLIPKGYSWRILLFSKKRQCGINKTENNGTLINEGKTLVLYHFKQLWK